MLMFVVYSYSQSLHVKSFDYAQKDLSARTNKRTDINEKACALLKVRLALPNAKFTGEITGTVEYKTSEYWVYLSPGAKKVNMAISGFLPLDVVFADYGYQKLESLNTYILTVELPASHNQSNQMQRVRFDVMPKNAKLKVDNLDFEITDGHVEVPLTVGTHNYSVSADYYVSQSTTLVLDGQSEYKDVNVKLSQAFGKLSVTTDPVDAEVVLMDKGERVIGKTPLNGYPLISGLHKIEIRKPGFKTITKELDIKDDSPISINQKMSTLIDATIKSEPTLALLTYNGKELGHTPRKIQDEAGVYDVELKAKHYYDYKGQINLDGTKSEILIKMKRRYFNKNGAYLEGNFQVGSLMGVGATVGAYISNVNIEASYLMGLTESEEIFWNASSSSASTKPTSYTYKPTFMGGKLGYGFVLGTRFRLTPQVGLGVTSIKGTIKTSGESKGVSDTYVASASIGAKLNIAVASCVGISLAPEYDFAMSKGKAFDTLSSASSKINGWGNGFNCKIGLNLFF